VDEDVEIAFPGVPALEDAPDLVIVADVAGLHEMGADGSGQRPDASLMSDAIELNPTSAPWL